MPGQHERSSTDEIKFDAWTVDINPHHQTIQNRRQSDLKGRRTLYDYVHHLRKIVSPREQSRNFNIVPPNSHVLNPQK